jgi:hypothetical protein
MQWGSGMRTSLLVSIAAASLVLSGSAWAKETGISGKSKTGCVTCHGTGVSAEVTVTLAGPSELAPGATGDYTLTVQGGPLKAAGLDVSIEPAGRASFLAESGVTQILNSELTHVQPKVVGTGASSITFNVKVKAGTTIGAFTLFAAGNSVNDNGSNDMSVTDPTKKDKFNITNKVVTIAMVAPPVDAGTPGADSGTSLPGTDAGTSGGGNDGGTIGGGNNPSGGQNPSTPPASDDDESGGGGCNATGGSLLGLGIALLGAITRRRRGN